VAPGSELPADLPVSFLLLQVNPEHLLCCFRKNSANANTVSLFAAHGYQGGSGRGGPQPNCLAEGKALPMGEAAFNRQC
jgi:hypothetical protein